MEVRARKAAGYAAAETLPRASPVEVARILARCRGGGARAASRLALILAAARGGLAKG